MGRSSAAACLALQRAGRALGPPLPWNSSALLWPSACSLQYPGAETRHRFSSSQPPGDAGKPQVGYFGWLREVFSEERIKERRDSLKDELKRGYVNDFKDLRANKGKVFAASDSLWGSQASKPFPPLRFVDRDDRPASFPSAGTEGVARASLACVAFRNGAEEMLLSWSDPFKSQFAGDSRTRVCELSLVDSAVMGSWPFRGMILKGASGAHSPARDSQMQPLTDYLFHFGETREARKALGITNMLTGYVYLLDSRGRVRWRGSGMAEQWEVDALLRCSMQLLEEKQ